MDDTKQISGRLKGILTNPTTLNKAILEWQQEIPGSTGDFSVLLQSIAAACKAISNAIRRAGIADLLGLYGEVNSTGDAQKKLDVLSDELFINAMRYSGRIAMMVSEEKEDIIVTDSPHARYMICFDPLDGSSNIDANVSVGTIFSIWKRADPSVVPSKAEILRPGKEMVAAGYALYGSATVLMISMGNGVHGFTLDPAIGEFVRSHNRVQIPSRGKIYSINEGNAHLWHAPMTEYVDLVKFPKPETGRKPYRARYVGSMVADVHRTLLYGGIFMYPNDRKTTKGKLRYLYEGAPMAFLMEQAGGAANTDSERLLDVVPTEIHMRTPVFMGSKEDVKDVLDIHSKHAQA